MSQIPIPPNVAELLEPISGTTPTGVNDENSEEYSALRQQSESSNPDYKLWNDWASLILKEQCKNIRIAVLLCYVWYRTMSLPGFRDGLILILELLKKYKEKLYPEKKEERGNSLKYLNRKMPPFFLHDQIDESNAQVCLDIKALFEQVIEISKIQFPEKPPELKELKQIITNHCKIAEKMIGTRVSSEIITPGITSTTSEKQEEKVIHPPVTNTEDLSEIPKEEQLLPIESNESEPSKPPDYEIPRDIASLLEPISENSPTGQAIFETATEFSKLERMTTSTTPNFLEWINLANDILLDITKDLRVAFWLAFAWYRKEKLPGLENGLILVIELLRKFGIKLFPKDIKHKNSALRFFHQKSMHKFLEKEKVDAQNAPQIIKLKKIFEFFTKEITTQFADQAPDYKELNHAIYALASEAEQFLKKTVDLKENEKEPKEQKGPTELIVPKGVSSEKDALINIKNTLIYFFEADKDGQKVKKVPQESHIYALSRTLQWGPINKMPFEKEKITQFEGPNKARITFLSGLISSNDWDNLITAIETDFLKHDSIKYWFEGQRYVVQALEAKGGMAIKAAEEIKIHLARLIDRVPGLPTLSFKDKQTPFASKETQAWLDDDVKKFGFGGGDAGILPPVMGEEYESINSAFEKAKTELPEGFENNAAAMQLAIAGDTRRKGRFLRKLSLANFCYEAKFYALAKVLLNELIQKIEQYQLTEWEPALCVAVWQSIFLTNIKLNLLEDDVDKKTILIQEQNVLFNKIGKYECIRALKLYERQPKEGE